MTKDEKKYISECNCDIIQNGWNPKVGDRCFNKYICLKRKVDVLFIIQTNIKGEPKKEVMVNTFHHINKGGLIFLPSLDQLLDMIGTRYFVLINDNGWESIIEPNNISEEDEDKCNTTVSFKSVSRRIACLRAVKEIRKEAK